MRFHYFLSCDWGTTHFRLRLVDRRTAAILDELKSAEGVARMAEGWNGELRSDSYSQLLSSRAEALLARNGVEANQCVVSGMASSRMGWKELPYAQLPQRLDGSGLIREIMQVPLAGLPALDILLISGVRSEENVMRGEEIELVGLAQQLPSLAQAESAILVMPGTHSKHVKLSRGCILDFDTFMTGELFAFLQTMPTLRAALLPSADFDESWFSRGLRESEAPGFFPSLFKIRSRNLLNGVSPKEGTAYLSGLLIGTELLQLSSQPGDRLFIASGGHLGALYRKAALQLDIRDAEFIDGSVMEASTIYGHLQILKQA